MQKFKYNIGDVLIHENRETFYVIHGRKLNSQNRAIYTACIISISDNVMVNPKAEMYEDFLDFFCEFYSHNDKAIKEEHRKLEVAETSHYYITQLIRDDNLAEMFKSLYQCDWKKAYVDTSLENFNAECEKCKDALIAELKKEQERKETLRNHVQKLLEEYSAEELKSIINEVGGKRESESYCF